MPKGGTLIEARIFFFFLAGVVCCVFFLGCFTGDYFHVLYLKEVYY